MQNKYDTDDTIVALATPNGVGAVSIVRLSGDKSIDIAQNLFSNPALLRADSHTVHYGFIRDNEGKKVDEVLISVFRAPRTYTTEDVVEISTHGSPYLVEQILGLCIGKGARLAQEGEFTLRAFLHGRIDLSQAEAVADLITVQNKSQQEIALKQLKGGLSHDISYYRDQLLQLTSLLELELDFGEEDVAFADRNTLTSMVQNTLSHLTTLIDTFQYGNAIKKGIPVAIVGKPNAGKSSLLNVLLNDNRAIVTDIPGTTRDTIEEQFTIKGITFRLIDTAGIRHTEDIVEKIGVAKTHATIQDAVIILYLYDAAQCKYDEVIEDLEKIYFADKKYIICANKIDLLPDDTVLLKLEKAICEKTNIENLSFLKISTKMKANMAVLQDELIIDYANKLSNENTILTNQRHYQSLVEAREALLSVSRSIESHMSTDLVALDLRRALFALGDITGEITNDEVLGNIFSKFCIGK